jgi:asparagine synthase (glutamine-hydrolysing)
MCGIAGILDRSTGVADIAGDVHAMTAVLAHRGPDGDGTWFDRDAGIAFGHRRLSILDLSEAGAQPMASAGGRWVITYNGEVYNAPDLRTELEAKGLRFRGHSDTEVVLEACAAWGVHGAVERLIGMFAFALWDREERTLYLVRDRLGIKPLYWGRFDGLFLFGSELKALREHKGWPVAVDRNALSAYMRFRYIPGPWTIYDGVSKLPPGCILTLSGDAAPKIEPYWDLHSVVQREMTARGTPSPEEAVEALETQLSDAVRRRMVSDVPLGALLSGGIDSSTVVALMQANSDRPVRTFSIGFREAGYNEAEHAKAVANHLGTDHTELYVEPHHAMDTIPRMAEIYDEPFGDSSQLPTFLVSELTRRHVTVALSGDGGDELFAGYHHYFNAAAYRSFDFLPASARALIARMIRLSPARALGKMRKLANTLMVEDREHYYRQFMSHWMEPDRLVPGAAEPKGDFWDPSVRDLVPDLIERMQFVDTMTYLPEDILTKVDRASMAVSLEARVPILDHRVVELAWSLPPAMKAKGQNGKWLLRQLLYRYVPRSLIDRPKKGFNVPIDSWLRGPLRDWAEDLLSEPKLAAGGIEPSMVRECWARHLSGQSNEQHRLWNVLMYQTWRERWM